jgi:hypothetical protein
MALFFQLLSKEELSGLRPEDLEALKATFYHTLYTNEAIKRELAIAVSQKLQAIRETRPEAGSSTR